MVVGTAMCATSGSQASAAYTTWRPAQPQHHGRVRDGGNCCGALRERVAPGGARRAVQALIEAAVGVEGQGKAVERRWEVKERQWKGGGR